MAPANRAAKTAGGRRQRSKPGVKREQILQVAIESFGRYGLYEIMGLAVADFQERFERITAEHGDWNEALVALLVDSYDLTEQEVLRNRVLVAEQGLIGIHRTAPREEASRSVARTRTRDLEFQWGTFLARGMQQAHIPETDPQLLSRALLGLYNSVWHWYRPGGTLALPDLGRFFVGRQLALVGADPKLAST